MTVNISRVLSPFRLFFLLNTHIKVNDAFMDGGKEDKLMDG